MPPDQFDKVPFVAGDGMALHLQRYRSDKPTPRGPVLLVHGAGVRGNIFNPPTSPNFVQFLADAGYDVWLTNWRASIEIPKNKWNLDQAAMHDHPAAVKKVCEVTGASRIKAVIHCQGSTSFMISAVKGWVPEVSTIVSNAVSMHPVIPGFSRFKLSVFAPLFSTMLDYLNPQWGNQPVGFLPRILNGIVSLSHWEKDSKVGKWVSFTYGAGFPALWELKQLNPETIEWIRSEFGNVPFTFFSHIRAGVRKGSLMSAPQADGSRHSYADAAPLTDARFILFAGKLNKCFKAQSQIDTFKWLETHRPGYHKLHVLNDYSHLDVFLGKNAARDVFPTMVQELNSG